MSGIEISNHFLLVRDLDWFATLEYQFHAPGFGHAAELDVRVGVPALEAVQGLLGHQVQGLLMKF